MSNMLDIMQQVAEKESKPFMITELGIVKAAYPHSDEGDNNNYQCDVELKNRRTDDGSPLLLKMVPVTVPYMGWTCIPNENDLVVVNFIGGDINAPIITGRLYNDEDRPPVNNETEFQIQHSLEEGGTFKMDADGVITLTSKSTENVVTVNDDLVSISNEEVSLTVDFSNETVSIISTKDIELKADNKISFEAKEMTIKTDDSVKLETNELSMKTQAATKIEAGSSMDIKSSAAMKLKGATIDLN